MDLMLYICIVCMCVYSKTLSTCPSCSSFTSVFSCRVVSTYVLSSCSTTAVGRFRGRFYFVTYASRSSSFYVWLRASAVTATCSNHFHLKCLSTQKVSSSGSLDGAAWSANCILDSVLRRFILPLVFFSIVA